MQQWQWLAAVGALVLAGCASSGKGGTDAVVQIQEEASTATKQIGFAPQRLDCVGQRNCPTLGAHWSSATPQRAWLVVGVAHADASVGEVQEVVFSGRPMAPIRVRSKASGAVPGGAPEAGATVFQVPMDTLERVAFAKGVTVQVHTSTGARLEEVMYNGEGSSAAQDALKRLVVEAYRGTDKEKSMGLLDMFGSKEPYQR